MFGHYHIYWHVVIGQQKAAPNSFFDCEVEWLESSSCCYSKQIHCWERRQERQSETWRA
jgi:hypothetical protein